MPGESRELPLDALPAGTTVDVIAAVLDDGTAIGDEAAFAAIFAHRAKERDALKAVVDAFNDVLPAKHGAEALAALQASASPRSSSATTSIPCHAALDAVQAYQQKSDAGRDRSARCAPTPSSCTRSTSSPRNTPRGSMRIRTKEFVNRDADHTANAYPTVHPNSLLPADRLAGELLVEPLRQRREVIEDRRRVHLLRAGRAPRAPRATAATGPSTASRSAARRPPCSRRSSSGSAAACSRRSSPARGGTGTAGCRRGSSACTACCRARGTSRRDRRTPRRAPTAARRPGTSGCRSHHALLYCAGRDLAGEHLPAPLIDQQAERQERDLLERARSSAARCRATCRAPCRAGRS